MQTFLPYPDFTRSAVCLDYRRLGKQRLEARTILTILTGKTASKAWRNHPAVLMWRGREDALREYYNACLAEWIARGYRNTMLPEPVPAAPAVEDFASLLDDPEFQEQATQLLAEVGSKPT